MANLHQYTGFHVARHQTSAEFNEAVEAFLILASDATNLFVGDVVKFNGIDPTTGKPTVTRITAQTDVPIGVVVGLQANPDNLAQKFHPASTLQTVFVATDPDVLLIGLATGTLPSASNIQFPVTLGAGGNTTTGLSSMTLGNAAAAPLTNAFFEFVDFDRDVGNDITSTGTMILVRFVKHQRK